MNGENNKPMKKNSHKITKYGNFFLSLSKINKAKTLMEVKFKDEALADLYVNGKTNDSKYKKLCKNKKLVAGFQRAVSIMYDVDSTEELKPFSFLHYEKLKYQKEPLSSVRLVNGMVERLLFTETEDGIEVELIEIDNTHYGNKK